MTGVWTAAAMVVGSAVSAAAESDSSKRAANTAKNTAGQQLAAVKDSVQQARGDLFNLFPSAEANSQKGYQSALDVFGQFMPQQASTFQQGNVAAQNQILAGMPQAHNALMGGAVDYSQFQPTQLDYDPSMFQQQLPEYQTIQQPVAYPTGPEQGYVDEPAPTAILSGQGFKNANKAVLEADPVNRVLKKLFSDERLKENIVLVGEIAGQNLYTWTWKDTEVTKDLAGDAGIGFIAQEVEKSLPHAVTEDSSGYKKITLAEIFKESK